MGRPVLKVALAGSYPSPGLRFTNGGHCGRRPQIVSLAHPMGEGRGEGYVDMSEMTALQELY